MKVRTRVGKVFVPLLPDVRFALSDVSAFEGMAMNAPDPRDLDNENSPQADFTLGAGSDQLDSEDHTARVALLCWDYAGLAKVRASHDGSNSPYMHLPADANGNWIADVGWKATANGQAISTLISDSSAPGFRDTDVDNTPTGAQNSDGDGLVTFEEYRGFVVRSEHRRTNPFKKDLFIDSDMPDDIGFAFNLPVTVHWVTEAQLSTNADPGSLATYLINSFYGNGSGSHTNQRGVRVRASSTITLGTNGETPHGCIQGSCTPNYVPTQGYGVGPIKIFVNEIMTKSPNSSSPTTPDDVDATAFKHMTGHEVGHMVGMVDYYVAESNGRRTLMISGLLEWINSQWTNFPTTYDGDVDDLRVH